MSRCQNRCGVLLSLAAALLFACSSEQAAHAELLGYWSADSTGGMTEILPNDQGNGDLDGELFEGAEYSADGKGHTGRPGDYAVSFPGDDFDYAALPPTDVTFEEITVTAWVNGFQVGNWAGIVLSRDGAQPIGLDYHAFDGMVNYIWNDDSSATWNFISDLVIPEEEWTFVALTVNQDQATLYAGPLGDTLESAVNEIPHFEQTNFTEWRLAEDNCCGPDRNFSGLIDDVSIWDEELSAEDLGRLHRLQATPLTLFGGEPGDFNNDMVLDAADIDLLSTEVRQGGGDLAFDVNLDGAVTDDDRKFWVEELRRTWFGDANMDDEFNSSDLVAVFAQGEYEDGIDGNSGWASGDWDGDANFSSGDIVVAFQGAGYNVGPRPQAMAVPEPSSLVALGLTMIPVVCTWRRRAR